MPELKPPLVRVPLPPNVVLTSISIGAHGQPAMLVTREESARVTLAIDATISKCVGSMQARPPIASDQAFQWTRAA